MPLLYNDGTPCFVQVPVCQTGSYQCDGCGYVGPSYQDSCGTHGIDSGGRHFCRACCRERDLSSMERGDPLSSYILGDGHTIGTWHGLPLAHVLSMRLHRRYRWSEVYNIRARDHKGRLWVGRGGGKGMYCNLRLAKSRA